MKYNLFHYAIGDVDKWQRKNNAIGDVDKWQRKNNKKDKFRQIL